MSIKSVIIGLFLGVVISGLTYFNEYVIGQGHLIFHLLPISVFGGALLLLLLGNPLLRLLGRAAVFSAGEIAVIVAIGLAACTWPGAGFFFMATTNAAMPKYQLSENLQWQAAHVMSYVPGASAEIAPGQIQDWPEFAHRLLDGAEADQPTPAARLWKQLTEAQRTEVRASARAEDLAPSTINQLLSGVNQALHSAKLYNDRAFAENQIPPPAKALLNQGDPSELADQSVVIVNRWLLVGAMPDLVLPPPAGNQSVLLNRPPGSQTWNERFFSGYSGNRTLMPWELPWGQWFPTLLAWGGLALLFGLASLCLAMIVHPQWANRELLLYPIPRFVTEMTQTDEGNWLPRVIFQNLFWVGFLLFFVHSLINGLHAWFPAVPEIPLDINFNPLREIFPTLAKADGSWGYFHPRVHPSLIAFAAFLAPSISFSIGISGLLWAILGAMMLTYGYTLDKGYLAAGQGHMLRFGAYVGMALIIGYTGRRYYTNVAKAAFGAARAKDTPPYTVWAARGLIFAVLGAMALLWQIGIPWYFAVLLALLIMLTFLGVSRIAAETGMIFIQPGWLPVGILAGLVGFPAVGPTAFILVALASIMVVGDTRTALMANIVNGLKLTDTAGQKPGRVSPWLLVMILAGFAVAAVATLTVQYNFGVLGGGGSWVKKILPTYPFNELASGLSTASARGMLAEISHLDLAERMSLFQPDSSLYLWMLAGFALVIGVTVARLRLPAWPLHPVAFLILGTYPSIQFAFSFLAGSAIKTGLIRFGGEKAFRNAIPLLVGVIAGIMVSKLGWILVGMIYFFVTGQQAPNVG